MLDNNFNHYNKNDCEHFDKHLKSNHFLIKTNKLIHHNIKIINFNNKKYFINKLESILINCNQKIT